jgi:hypothetical protein
MQNLLDIAKERALLEPFASVDVLLLYSIVAPHLKDFLHNREIATKIHVPGFRNILKRGTKLEPLYIEEIIEAVDEEFLKLRSTHHLKDVKLIRPLKDFKPLKVSKNYILSPSKQYPKTFIIFENKDTIKFPKKGRRIAEIDLLGVIDDVAPVSIEVKSGKAQSFLNKIRVDDWVDDAGKIHRGLRSRIISPLKELFGKDPHFILIVPKGEKTSKVVREINRINGKVYEFIPTAEDFKKWGEKLERIYKEYWGGSK